MSNFIKIKIMNTNTNKIEKILTERVVQVLPSKEKLKKLMRKKRIRLYLGIDPTSSKLHLGHTIGLRKLQEFADLGHEAFLVIGTGTVLAGDPSLRDTARPLINQEEIKKNVKSWKKQLAKVLDFSKVKIKYNSDWLLKLNLEDIIKIASHISAIKLFQREMFQRRIEKGDTVWFHETIYPLLQGYDSVALDVDLEIGGTDQIFNMLIGRELQQKIHKKEKFILTFPLIFGIDGKPMSKTSGNCIWLTDSADEMYGKIMSIPDNLIIPYFEFLTNISHKKLQKYKKELQLKKINPMILKEKLAFEITKMYHSKEKSERAKKEFQKVFRKKQLPSKITEIQIKKGIINILDLLVNTRLVSSKSEAKRIILQNGVKVDGQIENDWRKNIEIKKGMVIQVGKRKFLRIK